MINYELAKQLKDVGFPQRKYGMLIECIHGAYFRHQDDCPEGCDSSNFVSYPNLNELIEACGDKFHGMYKADDCIAHGFNSDDVFDDVYVHGQSFEEAVAKLWIELNKK